MESVYIDRICFSGKPGNSRTFAYTVHAPRPAIGEVLVAVHAVCLMPGDVAKLGCAFSGTVVFAPSAPSMADDFEKVHDWKAGDKVWGRSDAGWALSEIITVPAYALHKKDPKKSFAECATLGGPALLACRAVQQAFLGPEEKPKILVHGAHTALGTFAVQFAKVAKIQVECTILPSQLAFKRRILDLSADDVVELNEKRSLGKTLASLYGRVERKFTAIVDCLGTDSTVYCKMARYTHEGAKYLTAKPFGSCWRTVIMKFFGDSLRQYVSMDALLTKKYAADWFKLVQRSVDAQAFKKIEVAEIVPFVEVERAIELVLSGKYYGCIVVEVLPSESATLGLLLEKYESIAKVWKERDFANINAPYGSHRYYGYTSAAYLGGYGGDGGGGHYGGGGFGGGCDGGGGGGGGGC